MDGTTNQKNGPLLKMERRRAGMSQDDVALKSGITQATISRFESGDLNFRIDTLEPALLFLDTVSRLNHLLRSRV